MTKDDEHVDINYLVVDYNDRMTNWRDRHVNAQKYIFSKYSSNEDLDHRFEKTFHRFEKLWDLNLIFNSLLTILSQSKRISVTDKLTLKKYARYFPLQ